MFRQDLERLMDSPPAYMWEWLSNVVEARVYQSHKLGLVVDMSRERNLMCIFLGSKNDALTQKRTLHRTPWTAAYPGIGHGTHFAKFNPKEQPLPTNRSLITPPPQLKVSLYTGIFLAFTNMHDYPQHTEYSRQDGERGNDR